MPSRFALVLVVPALAALTACDPAYSVDVEITVADTLADEYDEQTRGVLVLDVDGQARALWMICGAEAQAITARTNFGDMGCPGSVALTAFIAPAEPDDPRPCGELDETGWDGELLPEWAQISATVSDPCDRAGAVELALD